MKHTRLLIVAMLLIMLLGLAFQPAFAEGEEPEPKNPIALFLAEQMDGYDYEAIVDLRETYGLGNIWRAYYLSEIVGIGEFDMLLDATEGKGWGKLFKEAGEEGLHPGKQGPHGLGWALKNDEAQSEQEAGDHHGPPDWAGGSKHDGPPGQTKDKADKDKSDSDD